MKTFTLVAMDNGACQAQAQFTPVDEHRVKVLAAIGLTKYVDRVVPNDEARMMWDDLRFKGWQRPKRTPVLTEQQLKAIIYR
jgi:hypothetical protein